MAQFPVKRTVYTAFKVCVLGSQNCVLWAENKLMDSNGVWFHTITLYTIQLQYNKTFNKQSVYCVCSCLMSVTFDNS